MKPNERSRLILEVKKIIARNYINYNIPSHGNWKFEETNDKIKVSFPIMKNNGEEKEFNFEEDKKCQ